MPGSVLAQTRTWDGGGADNNWSTAGNWSSDNAPDGTGEAALFTNDPVGQTKLTPNLSASVTIGQLQYSATAPSYTLGSSGAFILTLSPSASFSGVGLNIASGAANQTISANEIFLGSTQTWNIDGTSSLLVSGTMEDDSVVDSGITKTGTGTLSFTGDTRYDGPTVVNGGAVILSFSNTSMLSAFTVNSGILRATTSANALGNSSTRNTITLAGGALELANNSALTFGSTSRTTTVTGTATIRSDRLAAGAGVTHRLGPLSISAQTLAVTAGALVNSGTAGITVGATSLTGNATFEVDNTASAGAQLTLGAVSQSGGTRSLTKTGNGTLVLSGAGSYTGGTKLSQGAITLGIANALGSGGFNFAGGTLNGNNFNASPGAMAITANSVLNLTPGGAAATLTFAGASGTATGVLTITGWSGSVGGLGTNDKVIVSGGTTPSADFLQHIHFDLGGGNVYVAGLGTGGELFPAAVSGPVVPNVVNLTQAAATTAITNAGFVVGTVTNAASATVASGSVISQSPVGGAGAALGSAVNLVISTGPAPVNVPNVVGTTQAQATSTLTGAGLVASVTTQSSLTIPLGTVIDQSPTAGSSVLTGSTVTLTVSSGVTVPSVVGQTQSSATSALQSAGFAVSTSTAASATVALGNVISQSPAAGAQASGGSTVALVISSGAPPVTPAFVQQKDATVATGTTVSATLTNTAGNLLAVFVVWNNAGAVTVSDSHGNAYLSAVARTTWNSTASAQIFYAKNVAAGSNTVTATFATSVTSYGLIYVTEYSGLDALAPLDIAAAGTGTASAMTTPSVTTTNAIDILYAAGVSNRTVSTAGTGFTSRSKSYDNMIEDRALTAAGAYTATETQNGTAWVMQAAAFKAAGSSGPPVDSTPPSISITTPTTNAVVSGTVPVSGTAADNVGVSSVAVTVDNGTYVAATGTTSWSSSVNVSALANGTHTISARATDAAGNFTIASVNVSVNNPDVSPPSIPQGLHVVSTTGTSVSLAWTASTDNVGVAGYRVYNGGVLAGSSPTTSYTVPGLTAGSTYSFTVAAYDVAGNSSVPSGAVGATTPTPDITPPSIPGNLQVVTALQSSITFSWTASTDTVGVTGYNVYRDSVFKGTTAQTSFTDGGLNSGQSYSYTVTAFDAAGNTSNPSTPLIATTPDGVAPSVPGGLQTSSVTQTSLTLSWLPSTDNVAVTGYKVYRNSVNIATTAQTSYPDSGLTPGTSYAYTVAAFDAAGNLSTPSAPFNIGTTPDNSPPSVPQGLQITSTTQSSVGLSWTASNDDVGVAGYKIYRNTTLVGSTALTTYTDNTVAAATAYSYTVAAYDVANNLSAPSEPATTTTPDTSAPSVPTNLKAATILSSSITLTWTASTDNVAVTGYKIYRNNAEIGTSPQATYTDTNLSPATQYTYTVAAYDAANNVSSPSTPISPSTTDTTPPGVPGNLQPSNIQQTSLTLTWDASTDDVAVTGYKIFRNNAAIGTTAQLTYPDTGLIPGTQYTYTVAAYDAANNVSQPSTPITPTTLPDNSPPTVPQNLQVSNLLPDRLTLSWTASTDDVAVTGYKIYRNNSLLTSVTQASFADSELFPNTAYSYTVAAYDAAGNTSQPSAPLPVNTPQDTTPPTTPGSVHTTSVTSSAVALAWTPSTDNVNVTGYKIYRNTVLVGNTAETFFNDATVSPGTAYSYTVIAYDGSQNLSQASTPLSVNTPDTGAPTTPTGVQSTAATASTISLSWIASTDDVAVAGYKIYRNNVQAGTSATTTFTDTALTPSTAYSYTVAAYDAANNLSTQSSPALSVSTVADTTAPSVPGNLQVSTGPQSSLNLTWGTSTDDVAVTGYRIYRNSTQINTTTQPNYNDTGLTAGTSYVYTVAAYDAAGNVSAQSSPVTASTAGVPQSPAFVQEKDNTVGSGTTVAAAMTSANKAGDLLVAYVVWNNTNAVTLSDTRGNTYASAVGRTSWNGGASSGQIFYAKNVAAGTNTVTATFSTSISGWGLIYVAEYSGIDTTAPFDVGVAGSGTSGSLSSGNVTTLNPTDLLVAGGACSNTVSGAGTGFTSRSLSFGNILQDRSVTAVGSYSATASQNGAAWIMQMAAFKAANSVSGGSGSDPTPPSVTITTPTNNSQVSGLIPVSGTASDNVAVSSVAVSVDSGAYNNATGTTSWTYSLNTTTLTNGSHTINVRATDTSANTASTSTTVVVNNPDVTAPTVPANLHVTGTTANTVSLAWNASTDANGVTGYRIYRGGASVGTTAGLTYTDIGLSPGMGYTYTVAAFDAANNTSAQSSPPVSASTPGPDGQAPSTPGGLQTTAVLQTVISFSWTASTDNVGVTGYKIYRNNALLNSTTQTSYTDSGLTAGTTYSYTVAAYDAAGNNSTASTPLVVNTPTATTGPAYPVKQSANHKYLVDQNNVPFMIVGDSPHSMFVNLTLAQAETYLANRQTYGVNTIWVEILCTTYTGGRADATTYDGIAPLTSANNLATPNPNYFNRVDQMVNLAASHNITVMMDTIDTAGFRTALDNASSTVAYNYGVYLGTRYKNFPNIIWITGNDFRSWGQDPTGNANAAQIMKGIHDTDPNHLQTTELTDSVSGSLDDPQLVPYTTLAGAYTYFPTYAEVLTEYNAAAGTMPVFMEEADYEFAPVQGNTGTSATLRRQEYWTVLAGATGGMYGNYYIWPFDGAGSPGEWSTHMDTPGIAQFQMMANFFYTMPWWNLVPDQNHTFVTAGYGTYSTGDTVLGNNYVTAALSPDGTLGVIFLPTRSAITVNMAKFSGPVTAQWFDPSSAHYTPIAGSPLANSGSLQFTPTGNNSGGDTDWVLLLQVK